MRKYSYKVWESSSRSVEAATEIQAISPSQAAEEYADDDVDGQADGAYFGDSVRINVMDTEGKVFKFRVEALFYMSAEECDEDESV